MRSWITLLLAVSLGAVALQGQRGPDDRQRLRERIEAGYEVVPLSDGLALRPREAATRAKDIRLIEIAGGTITINSAPVSGGELRERVGSMADAILQLSYLTLDEQRALFAAAPAAPPAAADTPLERPTPPADTPPRARRASGDRVRIFGSVVVESDEEITGQVVAVFGSVRIDGEVGDQVVAVFGSIDLGPSAIVGGDIVAVGGRIRRAPTAQARRGVTEVSLSDGWVPIHVGPWFGEWGPAMWFDGFGALPRLIGTGFRTLLLLLVTGIALVLAGRSVEASAQRVSDNPLKATLIGLVAEIMIPPLLFITAVVLTISLIGIPLLLLLPFVVLFLIVLAIIGFAGTATAIGRWAQRRFGLGAAGSFVSIAVGLLVILSPLLLGRLLALAGWPLTPFSFLLVAAGFAVELLAWASGFGAVLNNAFTRWQAQRTTRVPVAAPPVVP